MGSQHTTSVGRTRVDQRLHKSLYSIAQHPVTNPLLLKGGDCDHKEMHRAPLLNNSWLAKAGNEREGGKDIYIDPSPSCAVLSKRVGVAVKG